MDGYEHKAFSGPLEIKAASSGEVEAIVGSIGTPDRDGDVLLVGSIRPNKAIVSLYAHDTVLRGAAPAGMGVVTEEGTRAIFRGKFFLGTSRGRDGFELVKELGDATGWSYGFSESDSDIRQPSEEWRWKGARRLLAGIEPKEVSPTFNPAGVGTRTVSTKDETDAIAREVERFEAAVERGRQVPGVPLPARFAPFVAWTAKRFAIGSGEMPEIRAVLPDRIRDGGTGMYVKASRTILIAAGLNDETTRATIIHEFSHHYEALKSWDNPSEGFAMKMERQLLQRWHVETRSGRR